MRTWSGTKARQVQSAVGFLRHASHIELEQLGNRRALNLPGVSCTIADQIAALESVAGTKVTRLTKRQPNPVIESIVFNWAQRFLPERAQSLGFSADADFESIINVYIQEELNEPASPF